MGSESPCKRSCARPFACPLGRCPYNPPIVLGLSCKSHFDDHGLERVVTNREPNIHRALEHQSAAVINRSQQIS
jgi:hypothetical protein